MKSILSVFAVTALMGFTVPEAQAYVPPSAFILKGVAAKHAGLKGLRIKTNASAMEGEKPGGARIKTLTYFNPQSGVLHAYALDDQNRKLYAIERRAENTTGADALLFWSNAKNLALALKARGIAIQTENDLAKTKDADERRSLEETRLARWDGKIAWVLGGGEAGGADAKSSQLWVEKDTFLPLRLIAPASAAADGPVTELQFESQRYYHEFPYPRVIMAMRNKQAILRDEVQEVALTLDSAEFRAALVPGFTDAGNSAPDPVRDLIKQYFEIIR